MRYLKISSKGAENTGLAVNSVNTIMNILFKVVAFACVYKASFHSYRLMISLRLFFVIDSTSISDLYDVEAAI